MAMDIWDILDHWDPNASLWTESTFDKGGGCLVTGCLWGLVTSCFSSARRFITQSAA